MPQNSSTMHNPFIPDQKPRVIELPTNNGHIPLNVPFSPKAPTRGPSVFVSPPVDERPIAFKVPIPLKQTGQFIRELLKNRAEFVQSVELATDSVIVVKSKSRDGLYKTKEGDRDHCVVKAKTMQSFQAAEKMILTKFQELPMQWVNDAVDSIARSSSESREMLLDMKDDVRWLRDDVQGLREDVDRAHRQQKRVADDTLRLEGDQKRSRQDIIDIKASVERLTETVTVVTSLLETTRKDLKALQDREEERLREEERIRQEDFAHWEERLRELMRQERVREEQRLKEEERLRQEELTAATPPLVQTGVELPHGLYRYPDVLRAIYGLPAHLPWGELRIGGSKGKLLKSSIYRKFPIDAKKTTMTQSGRCISAEVFKEFAESIQQICPMAYILEKGKWKCFEASTRFSDTI